METMTSSKIRLLEESANDEIVGMQGGYAQIRTLVTRHQRRWAGRKRRQSLWSTGRKTTLQAERPNLSPKSHKALPVLPARAKTGECDGIACFVMS